VLGFCYWQKQMYYPAFLQFKNLALDDEIKDTIYRLANDMETKGDYSRALEAFEFLNDRLPGFRDVKEHIERIRPAANRQAGGSGPSSSPSGGGLGGGGGYDMLKGSRFIILEELNRGSMGIVYKAKDQTLNEIVALKVLNDYLCTDPLAIERFKREARAAKKLSHQHIIRIHDLFEMNDKTFLSMEFIDGDDLKKMLQERKRIPSKEVARIGVQICEALEYAHKRGVVHRDVKPANVIVESLEPLEIKVADFGIAKQLNADDMTTGSRIMGTPLYMAPEQIEGRQVDARSDIYSLGVMLYEMVSGIPPFCEGNIEYQHIHKDPPPLPADVDAVLGKVILKAIAKRKEGAIRAPSTWAKP
jgi:serine/threonine protein kinase